MLSSTLACYHQHQHAIINTSMLSSTLACYHQHQHADIKNKHAWFPTLYLVGASYIYLEASGEKIGSKARFISPVYPANISTDACIFFAFYMQVLHRKNNLSCLLKTSMCTHCIFSMQKNAHYKSFTWHFLHKAQLTWSLLHWHNFL